MFNSPQDPQPQDRLHCLVVVGTRPEAIKLFPVIHALEASEVFKPVVISTGQHEQMVREVMDLAGVRIDATLQTDFASSGPNSTVQSVIAGLDDFISNTYRQGHHRVPRREEILAGKFPALTIVHGDTSSALAAAISAFHLRIPVVHVEAGLRCGGSILEPFPEELNRQLISRIACFHLAPTIRSEENLVREGVSNGQVFVTGNTAIDSLKWTSKLNSHYSDKRVEDLAASDRRMVVVTAHRRDNWGGGLRRIGEAVIALAAKHRDIEFVVPLHPNPSVVAEFGAPLGGIPNVTTTEPLQYGSFAQLLGRCDLVITDSGGIQEEAPSLDKPVLVTRNVTERQEAINAGTVELVGTDPQVIEQAADRLLGDPAAYAEMASRPNPYGDGMASQRIVDALAHLALDRPMPAAFASAFDRSEVLASVGFDNLAAKPMELALGGQTALAAQAAMA